jgi:hypothetical protein
MMFTSQITRTGLSQRPGPIEQRHDNPLERRSVGFAEHLE